MDKCNFVKHMRIAVLSSGQVNEYDKIKTTTGESVYVSGGYIIRLLSENFQFSFDLIPNDVIGKSTTDGNWTGCIGSVQQKEADIAICSIAVTEERSEVVAFTHPYMYTPITFLTDKLTNMPNKFAIFYTFSWHIWLAFVLCFSLMSFLIYKFFRRKPNYSIVLLNMLGIAVEQSFQLKPRISSARLIMMSWIIGVMFLTYSYKAVLLASFSFPTLSGVRDIIDLSKASQNPTFQCLTSKRSYIYKSLVESESELIKPISKCLKRTPEFNGDVTVLLNSSFKKAAIYGKFTLTMLKRKFFISDDTFFTAMAAVAVNRKFRCFNALNDAILRIYEAGFSQKYQSYEEFLVEMKAKSSNYINPPNRILRMDDLFGAFIILLAGLLLSTLILAIDIMFYRLTKSQNRITLK